MLKEREHLKKKEREKGGIGNRLKEKERYAQREREICLERKRKM